MKYDHFLTVVTRQSMTLIYSTFIQKVIPPTFYSTSYIPNIKQIIRDGVSKHFVFSAYASINEIQHEAEKNILQDFIFTYNFKLSLSGITYLNDQVLRTSMLQTTWTPYTIVQGKYVKRTVNRHYPFSTLTTKPK